MTTRQNKRKTKQNRRRTHRVKNKKTRVILSQPIVYGRIHATWCGHCTSMAEDWKRLDETVLKKNSELKQFDIESEEKDDRINEFMQMYKSSLTFNGYPTIYKLYKLGGPIEYYEHEDRSENAIHKWLFSRPIHNI